MARGDIPKNKLDAGCREHDLRYLHTTDLKERHIADEKLQKIAKERINSSDSTLGERLSSRLVNFVMAAKRKMGAGFQRIKKKKKITFEKNVKKIQTELRLKKPKTQEAAIIMALNAARRNTSTLPKTRIIKIPSKSGGFLPLLIPIIAALSSVGGIASGVSSVVKTINEIKDGKKKLSETERHNRSMEGIALKNGRGMFLRPYKNGFGLSFQSPSKNY